MRAAARVVHTVDDLFDAAHAEAERSRSDPAAAVHELRRALRRARALLELLREGDDDPPLDALAARLRLAHRRAGALRDPEIVADELSQRTDGGPGAWIALGARAETARKRARARVPATVARLLAELDGARPALAALAGRDVDLEAALARSERRARRDARRAAKDDDEDFEAAHRLRRRLKVVVAQAELVLAPSKRRDRYVEQATAAGKKLGGAADLAVTREWVRAQKGPRGLVDALDAPLARRCEQGVRRATRLKHLIT